MQPPYNVHNRLEVASLEASSSKEPAIFAYQAAGFKGCPGWGRTWGPLVFVSFSH